MQVFIYLLFWTLALARAEYRAFELSIEDVETGKTRSVTSTLDHIQYRRYYPVANTEAVLYVDSWMCWENTNRFRAVCPKPEDTSPTVLTPEATP